MSIRLDQQIVCFGSTLARKMAESDARTLLEQIDHRREIGTAHVVLAKTGKPFEMEVHFLPHNINPQQAIASLATALAQLKKIYGNVPAPMMIAAPDAERIRAHAEQMVDFIRSGTIKSGPQGKHHDFEQPREMCVRMLTIAFATVAVLSPSALAKG